MIGWLSLVPLAVANPTEHSFQYTLSRKVEGTGGEYVGYSDKLVARGRYTVLEIAEGEGQGHATYSWRFDGSDGKAESGNEDRSVTFQAFHYTSAKTDLDEYDTQDPKALGIWFRIPTTGDKGAKLRILDKTFTVKDREAHFGSSTALELEATGTGERHDAYGNFRTSWNETALYDRATGLILADVYEEKDEALDGSGATFALHEAFVLRTASYAAVLPPTPTPTQAPPSPRTVVAEEAPDIVGPLVLGAAGVGGLAILLGVGWAIAGARIKVEPLTDLEPLRSAQLDCSAHFHPFLVDFADSALRSGDRVQVVRSKDGTITGLSLTNQETGIGTVFAKSAPVARALAAEMNGPFFSEVALDDRSRMETFAVMTLAPVPSPSWDTSLVRRAKPEDLDEIEALSKLVYEVPCRRWLEAHLQSPHEVVYVAQADGRIVGFAFATVIDEWGRTHTITLHPDFRNRGIGTELLRARLRALHDLGVERVLTEISTANVGSHHLSTKLGFKKAGEMIAYASSGAKPKRWIRR